MRLFPFYTFLLVGVWMIQNTAASCSKSTAIVPEPHDTVVPPVTPPFDINSINDTYGEISSVDQIYHWGSHNVHDPSVIKDGDYFYCYNTDVAYGTDIKPGIQIRRSKDLINWQFYGWVFSGIPAQGAAYIQQHGSTAFNSLWAPYVIKVGSELRLYYSLSSPKLRLSTIGLATAPTPVGPWTEKGLVVSSTDDNSVQTNAIDPTILIDRQGRHWMYYGSAWDGIYMLELNPVTGLAKTGGSRGVRIAHRGFTGGQVNGNIEGAEIIYNAEQNKYYLFMAYDWLQTKYNVRVGRADTPEGPFYDFKGRDMNLQEDHSPMILAPYQFAGHGGYQGVAHCGVFYDNGQWYMAHQARPSVNSYFMNLHIRKIFWTQDGWPVVSPERYAGTTQTALTSTEIAGEWQQITLGYHIVPGYANEQISPDLQVAASLKLNADGTMNSDAGSHWNYAAPWLELAWSNGNSAKVMIERGRDWENKKECLIFTGLNNEGTAIWGKK